MKRALFALLCLGLATAASAVELTNEITPDNIIRLMNEYRATHGLAPLHEDERLNRAAHDRMRDMEDGGWWNHQSPDGVSPFVWLTARDYPYAVAGENLACGFETVNLLVSSWMESPGHRANIMGADFADCGIAIIDGSTKGPANGKSIVVMFAKKRASSDAH